MLLCCLGEEPEMQGRPPTFVAGALLLDIVLGDGSG